MTKRCTACNRVNADDATECVACQGTEFEQIETGAGGGGRSSGSSGPRSEGEKAFLDQIKEYATENQVRNPRVIVFFGHSSSGKSWLITRVKQQNGALGYFAVDPPLDREGRVLGTSFAPRAHLMHCAPKDGLVLVDIEGERFTDAMDNGFRGEYRVFVEALAYAHGFAFLVPASEALYPNLCEKYATNGLRAHVANDRMQSVLNNIGRVNAFLGYLQEQKKKGLKPADAVDAFLAMDDAARTRLLNAGARRGGRTDRPAIVLLSKADSLQQLMLDAASDDYDMYAPHFDHDPMGDIALSEGPVRMLLKAFRSSFRRFRVDFVTSFAGHVEFPDGATSRDITWDTSKPHCGVVEAIEWLRDEIKSTQGLRRVINFNLGVGPALWLRGVLDRDFRRAI